jgi:DNA-binding transcriptional LysR family regulator
MPSDAANTVDLKRMRMVVEVTKAGAITTAAAVLGLTQSAVSRGVAEVEAALGVRIFERLPRGIRLTDAGQRFVARAGRFLAEVDDLVSEVREVRARVSGRLRIGVTASGTHATWALATFAHAHPDVAIETASGTSQALCPRLIHGELDLILGSSSYLRRWRDLEVTVLAPLHFACMFRKDHPLADRQRPSEVEVLRYPVIFSASVEPTYSDLAQRYVHHGLPRFHPQYVTDDFGLVRRLVHKTDAFFPLMWSNESFGDLGRAFLLLRGVVLLPTHHISFARAAHRPKSAAIEALERLLVQRLGPPARERSQRPLAAGGTGARGAVDDGRVRGRQGPAGRKAAAPGRTNRLRRE